MHKLLNIPFTFRYLDVPSVHIDDTPPKICGEALGWGHSCSAGCRYDTPLVADIHFQPAVAMAVADAFEKIRINPGNFVDGRKTFDEINYDDESQFRAEQEHIREVPFSPSQQNMRFHCTAHGQLARCTSLFHLWMARCFFIALKKIFSVETDKESRRGKVWGRSGLACKSSTAQALESTMMQP